MYPVPEKIPLKKIVHGVEMQDDYAWMRDANWPQVTNEKILEHLNKENAYSEAIFFDKHKDLKELIFNEIKDRIKLTDQSSYIKLDNYFYYSRTEEDKNYTIFCRKYLTTESEEEIILDINKLAEEHQYTSVESVAVSPDHTLLAYAIDHRGDERYSIKILNLKTKKYLKDEIENVTSNIVWHTNGTCIFYVPLDQYVRHKKVLLHSIIEQGEDKLIYEEFDDLFNLSIGRSGNRQYLFIDTYSHHTNEIYALDMIDTTKELSLIAKRKDSVFYTIDHNGNYFYILTNDIGPNFRLIRATIGTPSIWEDYIFLDSRMYLSSFDITKDFLVLNYKNSSLPLVRVVRIADKEIHDIHFLDEIYTASGFSTNFFENDIRISYTSPKRPETIYTYDFDKDVLEVLKVSVVPSGFNPDEYEAKREWAENEDVRIPISILYKKSTFRADGTNQLYLYGYGSYGLGLSAGFNRSILSLVDRGWVYAIAHIRGGDEMGFQWYENAKFLNKKRTFKDFIAVTKALIEQKYTSKGNITISGGSAGGMLIGAIINTHPELYKAAVAQVPFVDVVNTMLDETLPLTPGEFKEWGDPKEKQYFEYIKSYSPYDNIKKQDYPHIFATASISDYRVGYWEAAKWVALLRDNNTSRSTILLKVNMNAGHCGPSGRFDYLKEIADLYVFVLKIPALIIS